MTSKRADDLLAKARVLARQIRQPAVNPGMRRGVAGSNAQQRSGSGHQFWDYEALRLGDAIDRIDWRRSASSDTVFRRRHEAEAAPAVLLWCDASASMAFASAPSLPSKQDAALILLAAAALIRLDAGERVGIAGVPGIHAGPASLPRLMDKLLALEGDALPRRANQRERVLLAATDALQPGGVAALGDALASWSQPGSGGALLHVVDPQEATFALSGPCLVDDCEGGQPVLLAAPETMRQDYLAAFAAHQAAVRAAASRPGWTAITVDTAAPTAPVLTALLDAIGTGTG